MPLTIAPSATRIKVSGITTPQDAEAAVAAGIDMLACVFYAGSPRYVTLEQAWSLRRVVPAHVTFVGIFVDTPMPLVRRVAAHCGLDRVQLFGAESREAVEAVGNAFKAVTVRSARELDEAVRTHLTKRVAKADAPILLCHLSGDIGSAWQLAADPARKGPIVVAGAGLSAATVGELIRAARPWAVDVWDAVESSPGRLERSTLVEFVEATRAADREGSPTGRTTE